MVIFRYVILLFIFLSCQRNIAPQFESSDFFIDSTLQLFSQDIPLEVQNDIHHLLKMAFHNSGTLYDSLQVTVYYDPKLMDSIYIHSKGTKNFNFIIGNTNNAKIAFYTLLDIFGFRFYGPDDHWTYIPQLSNYPPIDTTLVSFFSLRKLIPSYGASRNGIQATDTSGFLFTRWMNRLRMANLYKIDAGHYGTTFNIKYRDEISANPEWRGINSNGEIKDWSQTLKLCYSNPGVISLYKKDAAIRLRKQLKNSIPPYFITMDPPDGGGFCQCPNCGSPSNQVYNLANEVAKHLYTIDTNAYVTLYGYNQHAEIPEFQLENNIVVGIVPNAFQNVGSPEKMMKEWESTGAMLYLRDYIAIPIWHSDKPTYRPNGQFLKKINRLRNKRYLGYHFETTASFMATGLKFYLLSTASWNKTNESEEFSLFLKKMFPGYEEDISLIYENFPDLNNRTFTDAINIIHSIQKDVLKIDDPSLLSRLNDLEFYIEYLYLLNKFNEIDSEENLNLLLDKIMSLPGSRLLHPYGLYRVLKRRSGVKRALERTSNFPVDILPTQDIQLTLRRHVEKEYKALYPNFYMDSVNSFVEIPIRNAHGLLYVGNSYGAKVLFKARLKWMNNSASGVIIFRDLNNNYVTEVNLIPDNKWRRYELNLEPDQFYRLYFRTPGSELFFQGPNRPFSFSSPLYTRYTHKRVPYYFMIPENQPNAIIQIPRKSNEVVVKSKDKILINTSRNETYQIDLPNKEGQIIELIMFRHGVRLINLPQLISLHPKAIIIQNNFNLDTHSN